MNLLYAVGEWLQSLEVGVLEADLFLGERPSRPVALVAASLTGAAPPDIYRPVERVTLTCTVREETAGEALERAEALNALLHGRENFPLGEGWWGYLCVARQRPALAGGSRPERAAPGALATCAFLLTVRRG